MEDFRVETKGCCFICTTKIGTRFPYHDERGDSESGALSCSVHSIQYLSRYLNMDMRKVFDEEDNVPPELLAKVKRARLKVELCEECSSLNKSFSKLYRKLEKIEMEVASRVSLIHRKLDGANEAMGFLYFHQSDINTGDGKFKIAEKLRMEAKQKCLSKLKDVAAPRIKMQRWSMNQINNKRRKLMHNSRTRRHKISSFLGKNDVFEAANNEAPLATPKGEVEEEHPGSQLSDNDDAGNGYFDHDDDNNEEPGWEQSPSLVDSTMLASSMQDEQVQYNNSTENESMTAYASMYETEAGEYKCKVCSKRFHSKPAWQLHYQSIHQNIRYKCNLCGKEFSQRGNYDRHHKSVHVGMKFKCLVCNKTFTQKGRLTEHQKTGSCKTVD